MRAADVMEQVVTELVEAIEAGAGEWAIHASPITHRRRGHWRRQRVGPREDWYYERRLIAPIIVNPGGPSDDRLTIYRLPPPPVVP